MTFTDLNLIDPILDAITKQGYEIPSPIQEQAIPHLLGGKDLIGISQTGSGKTAAFLLPIIQHLVRDRLRPVSGSPRALILSPTRELAAQISDACKTYGKFTKIKHAVVYGGVRQNPQVSALVKGVDILVATPGRLMDLMDQGHIKLDLVEIFVLDEADRMLDMGFVKDIRKLLPYLPEKRQTIMFSATMSKEIDKLARDFLRDPVKLELASQGSTVASITQELFFVDKNKKIDLLLYLMRAGLNHVLVFTRTKAAADKVARALVKAKIPADALHGDKSQAQRTRVLDKFQKGKITLVATDVAARGIDVDDISHVINFDLPNEAENYTHRIGRTGRAGKDGVSLSFCDETEKDYLVAIQKLLKKEFVCSQHPFHSEAARHSTQKARQRGGGFVRKGGRGGFKRGRAAGRMSGRAGGSESSSGRKGDGYNARSSSNNSARGRSFKGRHSPTQKKSFGASSKGRRR